MEVRILQLLEGARRARGLAVVIDVFRAFSVAPYLFAGGAQSVIPVDDVETAYRLKREHPDYLLIGERGLRPPPGFDFGNSPTEVEGLDFTGRTIVHATSAGTRGLVGVGGADEVITGSFVNAPAIVRYIEAQSPSVVSLVCMGREAVEPTDEDTLCAEWIRDSLSGLSANFDRECLRAAESARKFFDPQQPWVPERDFELCLDLGRFDFVLRLERTEDSQLSLRKVLPSSTAKSEQM